MAKSSKTPFALLGMLSLRPMSGYEIKKMMAQSTDYFWSESNGQIYPTLKRLSEQELVQCREELVGAKLKKVYEITNKGIEELKVWLQLEVEQYPHRNELLLKLFFGHNVETAISKQHIEDYAYSRRKALALFKEIEVKSIEKGKKLNRPFFSILTLKYGIKIAEAQLAWCEESLQYLESTK